MTESTLAPALEAWQTDAGRAAWRKIGDLLRTGFTVDQIADRLKGAIPRGAAGGDPAPWQRRTQRSERTLREETRYRVSNYAAMLLHDPPYLHPWDIDRPNISDRLTLVLSGYANPADEQERRQALGILRRRLEAARSLRPLTTV